MPDQTAVPDQPNAFKVVSDATGTKLQVLSNTVHIQGQGGKDLELASIDVKTQCPCTVVVDPSPLPGVHSAFDVWVLVALTVPLILATIFGSVLVAFMLCGYNRVKTVDKLAQLLSEDDGSGAKMSFSRVQALIFTYIIAFGCLLIIARTGNFPAEIPTNLGILAGGSLATYLISKGIQRSTP